MDLENNRSCSAAELHSIASQRGLECHELLGVLIASTVVAVESAVDLLNAAPPVYESICCLKNQPSLLVLALASASALALALALTFLDVASDLVLGHANAIRGTFHAGPACGTVNLHDADDADARDDVDDANDDGPGVRPHDADDAHARGDVDGAGPGTDYDVDDEAAVAAEARYDGPYWRPAYAVFWARAAGDHDCCWRRRPALAEHLDVWPLSHPRPRWN